MKDYIIIAVSFILGIAASVIANGFTYKREEQIQSFTNLISSSHTIVSIFVVCLSAGLVILWRKLKIATASNKTLQTEIQELRVTMPRQEDTSVRDLETQTVPACDKWNCRDSSLCFHDNCVPAIQNETLKLLTPVRNHMFVDEHNYSEEFSTALPKMNDERKWLAFLESLNKVNGSIDLKEAPRVFLVCAYSPMRIIQEVLKRLFSTGLLIHADEISLANKIRAYYKTIRIWNAEAAFESGRWREDTNEGEAERNLLVQATDALFPHFKAVRERHSSLQMAIISIVKTDTPPITAKDLDDYVSDSAVVRLMIRRKGEKLQANDTKDDKERLAIVQAWKYFWEVNGSTPCYFADVESISKRVTNGPLLPYTDFAIITHVNKDRVIEVWDFYGESHLLITHGRPQKCVINGDVTPYENLMEDWRQNHSPHSSFDPSSNSLPEASKAELKIGYLRIFNPKESKKELPRKPTAMSK